MVNWKNPPRPWRAFARERYHNIRNYTNNLQGSNSIYTNGTDYRLLREQTREKVHKQERERWNGEQERERDANRGAFTRNSSRSHGAQRPGGPRSVPLAQRPPFSNAFLWVLARVRNSACSLAHNRRVLSPSEGWKHTWQRERKRKREREREHRDTKSTLCNSWRERKSTLYPLMASFFYSRSYIVPICALFPKRGSHECLSCTTQKKKKKGMKKRKKNKKKKKKEVETMWRRYERQRKRNWRWLRSRFVPSEGHQYRRTAPSIQNALQEF